MMVIPVLIISVLSAFAILLNPLVSLPAIASAVFLSLFFNSKNKSLFIYLTMIIIFFFYPVQYIPTLNFLRVVNPLTVLGVLLAFMLIFHRKDRVVEYKFINRCYFIFILIGIIGAILTKSKLGAINWLFYSYFTGFIVYKYILTLKEKELNKIIDTLLICGFMTFCYGIFEYVTTYSLLLKVHMHRFTSLLGHPLTNAFIFGILLFIALSRYSKDKKKVYLFLATCFLIGIILTKARGAWFVLVIISVFSAFKYKLNIKYLKITIPVILIVAALYSCFFQGIIAGRLSEREDAKHSSWNVRKESIAVGLELIKKYPFVGIGLFNSSRFKKNFTYDDVIGKTSFENSYYEIVVETGILGGLSYFFILIFVLCHVVGKKEIRSFFIASSFIFMVLHAATFPILNIYRYSHFIYWTVIALTLKISEKSE